MGSDVSFEAVHTPRRGFAPLAALLSGRTLPALAARIGIWWARRKGRPIRFGKRVIAVRHADVKEMLHRDLDFLIAPVNESRINTVNGGPFILGMDRSPALLREREALYTALSSLHLSALATSIRDDVERYLSPQDNRLDAISDFARPIATATASKLFGIAPADTQLFAEAVRAIFAHTFLNLGGDKTVETRAQAAGELMKDWFEVEIENRRQSREFGNDLMGALLRQDALSDDDVRRNLGGMLVGSIDTSVSTFARVFCVIDGDAGLRKRAVASWRSGEDIYGLCLDALRFWPHNPILLREAAVNTKLGGVTIAKGTPVIAWTEAAMQDSQAFPDRKRVLPDRSQASYLHFGSGLHACAGRVVNAIQIPVLVGTLLDVGGRKAGRMKWAGPFPDSLPVRFEKEGSR